MLLSFLLFFCFIIRWARLTRSEKMAECVMTCLFNSLEKMSEGKRRIFFYVSFLVGGTLTIGGFAAFATPHRGWAFIVVVSGIFILITTGILWDTMAPQCGSGIRSSTAGMIESPTAPREEDDPPPDYESVVRADATKNPTMLPRSNSKWSLYNQSWCPSFGPKSGYGKTATSETSCVEVVAVSDLPPSYKQSQTHKLTTTNTSTAEAPAAAAATTSTTTAAAAKTTSTTAATTTTTTTTTTRTIASTATGALTRVATQGSSPRGDIPEGFDGSTTTVQCQPPRELYSLDIVVGAQK